MRTLLWSLLKRLPSMSYCDFPWTSIIRKHNFYLSPSKPVSIVCLRYYTTPKMYSMNVNFISALKGLEFRNKIAPRFLRFLGNLKRSSWINFFFSLSLSLSLSSIKYQWKKIVTQRYPSWPNNHWSQIWVYSRDMLILL